MAVQGQGETGWGLEDPEVPLSGGLSLPALMVDRQGSPAGYSVSNERLSV